MTASVREIEAETQKAVKALQAWFKINDMKLDTLDLEYMTTTIELALMNVAWKERE